MGAIEYCIRDIGSYMKKVSVVVADDHSIIRDAMSAVLDTDKFELVGKAENGIELMALVDQNLPDIAVIDLEMPAMNGYKAISELHKKFPDVKLVAFSGFMTPPNQKKVISMGASATLSKGEPVSELIKALDKVSRGGTYHSDVSTVFWPEPEPLANEQDTPLTQRETQILTMVANGMTSKEISKAYFISEWTVNKHRANIKSKLGMRSISDLVRYAMDKGYISQ